MRLLLNLVECLYAIFKPPDADIATKRRAQARLRLRACFVVACVCRVGAAGRGPRDQAPRAGAHPRAVAPRVCRVAAEQCAYPPAPAPCLPPQVLLSKLLECFVAKLGALREDIPPLIEARARARALVTKR